MLQLLQGPLSLLGRIMLCAIFFTAAVANKIPQFSEVVKSMAKEGVPAPELMLTGAIVFLTIGSLCVITGFQARIGAAALDLLLSRVGKGTPHQLTGRRVASQCILLGDRSRAALLPRIESRDAQAILWKEMTND